MGKTAKKRILGIWGQGGGYGHAARLTAIARELGNAGHTVHLAVKDKLAFQPFAGAFSGTLSECPVYRPVMKLNRHQASIADLLLLSGFADQATLSQLVQAWLALFSTSKPDVIIADHAPAALLAALQTSCPVFITGNPFVTPVPGQPLTDWRPEAPDDLLVSRTESLVLKQINGLPGQSGRSLTRLSDLFACKACLLTCYPVLDPSGKLRVNPYYCAANLTEAGSAPAGSSYEIVCYLKSGFLRLRQLARALADTGRSVLILVPGLDDQDCRQLSTGNVLASNAFADLEQVLAGAGLFIGHGNLNTLNQCLRKAVPMLLLPMQLENLNHALQLRNAGLAQVSAILDTREEYAALLGAVMDDRKIQDRLERHARQHWLAGESSVATEALRLVDALG